MPDPTVSSAASKARWQGIIIGLVIGLIAGGVAGVMAPDMSGRIMSPGAGTSTAKPHPSVPETPVAISLKGEGASRAVVVKNTGAASLANVKLDASNPRGRAAASATIGALAPGETKEIASGPDWTWTFAPGDVFEVSADGFSAKSFTAP